MIRHPFGLAAALCVLSVLASCMDETVTMGETSPSTLPLAVSSVAVRPSDEQRMTVYLTGYGYWDNTPPGSAAISKPVIHNRAGGTGTYANPITIAVGHTIIGSRQTLDYAPGTRFYIERLRKYAIVEDVCGDGRTPQAGPCHTGYQGHPWLDLYIGGARADSSATNACARHITALQTIVMNPGRDYPVHEGEVTGSGCQVF